MLTIKLYRGDCLDMMKKIPDSSVDCIICDLPYGTTRNRWDTIIPFRPLWVEYERVSKDNAAIILFGSGMFTADLMQSNRQMWRYNIIWKKSTPTGFLNANKMPLRAHEDILVFYKTLPVYHPQMTHNHSRKTSSALSKLNSRATTNYGHYAPVSYDSTDRYPISVWEFATDKQKSALHPTQKPVALLEELVKTYSDPGDVVLDNCMGSGTTGIACRRLKRSFIGIEKDPYYFSVAKERILDSSAT